MPEPTRSMSVTEAIHARHAVRSYAPTPLDEATVRALLDAAVHAPTAIHLEPWAFVVVQDRKLLRQISDRAKALIASETSNRPPHVASTMPAASAFVQMLARPDFNLFYDAGTLIVICARPLSDFVVADCWLAAENLMLAACAMGLGSCVIGAALRALSLDEVKADLGIPREVTPIAPIILGVPDVTAIVPTPRRPPEILAWKK